MLVIPNFIFGDFHFFFSFFFLEIEKETIRKKKGNGLLLAFTCMVSDADCLIGHVTLYLPFTHIQSYYFTEFLFKGCEYLSQMYFYILIRNLTVFLKVYIHTVLFLITRRRTELGCFFYTFNLLKNMQYITV